MLIAWLRSLLSFPNADPKKYLIVGLGNPGSAYDKTRHNVGFMAVRYYAKRHGIDLKKVSYTLGEWGKKEMELSYLHLLLPLTYMNQSGESVKKVLKKDHISISHMIVVVDDVSLPLGKIRLRKMGSCGGHNGLKNIEAHLGTSAYARLRIGIGSPTKEILSEYVLSNFKPDEEAVLQKVYESTADILDFWIQRGIDAAMTKANSKGVI